MIRPTLPSFGSAIAPARVDIASRLRRIRASLDKRVRRAAHGESGSSIIEFALASVILFTLVFGVIAICLALYTYNVVAETAREATRYAMVRGSSCSSFADCPNVTAIQIQAYVGTIAFPGIDPGTTASPKMVATPSWPAGNENPGNPVQVTVTYTLPLNIPFVPSRLLSMSSTSQMYISQ